MLEEAVHVIRELMTGKQVTHEGEHYTVQTARLYSVPDDPPPVYMSGYGEKSARLAGRIADGYMHTQPDADLVRVFRESGGGDRPVQGGVKVCWGPDEAAARATMHRLWPTDEIPGEAAQLLPAPPVPRAVRAGHRGDDRRAVRAGPGRARGRRAGPISRRVRRGLREPGRPRRGGLLRLLRQHRAAPAPRGGGLKRVPVWERGRGGRGGERAAIEDVDLDTGQHPEREPASALRRDQPRAAPAGVRRTGRWPRSAAGGGRSGPATRGRGRARPRPSPRTGCRRRTSRNARGSPRAGRPAAAALRRRRPPAAG